MDKIEIQFTSGRTIQVEDNWNGDLINLMNELAEGPVVVGEGEDGRDMIIFPKHVESITWVRED
jgi:hypothetical protein